MTNGSISAEQNGEWKEVHLSQGISLLSGHHVLAQFCNDHGIGTPYLTGPSDFPDGRIANTKYTTRPTTICKSGDILVTVKGSGVGSLAFADGSYCISRQLMAVRTTDWNSRFVYYLLASSSDRFSGAATGLIPGLSRSDLLELRLLLPSRSEQNAIAQALRDIDDLIASLDALIAKKRDIKQAAMQQLLTGKTRLPPFAKTSMVLSEIGELPEDWEVRTLASLGEPLIGLTYRPSDVRDTGTLVLRSSNVQDGNLSFENNVFVDPEAATRALVAEGDILICVRNGSRALIGKCAIIDARASGMAFGAFMAVFRSPHSAFLHHQFQSNTIQKQIHEHLGATINQITNASLRSFKVPFPKNPDERSAIVAILSDIGSELSALDDKVSKLRAVREGMMQQLLTGRIRLV